MENRAPRILAQLLELMKVQVFGITYADLRELFPEAEKWHREYQNQERKRLQEQALSKLTAEERMALGWPPAT